MMDTTKHTPGPWHAADDGGEVFDAEYIPVCYMNGIGQASEFITEKEAEANARLIAAAPELLEACIEMRGYLAGLLGGDESESQHVRMLDGVIRKAEEG